MNIFLSLIFALLNAMTGRANNAEFGAVTDSLQENLRRRYLEEWSRDPPSAVDPASQDDSARVRVCQDLTDSEVFKVYARYPVSFAEARAKMTRAPAEYDSSILQRYDCSADTCDNSYRLRQIRVEIYPSASPDAGLVSEIKNEYTFACFLEERSDEIEGPDRIIVIYVSKVYDVHKGLHAHRFVFHELDGTADVMVAERSADVYTRPDFNIELHYLELRRRHRVNALDCNLDPVCKFAMNRSLSSTGSQTMRLCAIVLSSSYFREKFEYPSRLHFPGWFQGTIAFTTEEGRRAAESNEYFELMLCCFVKPKVARTPGVIYISRAYNPHQVFVYYKERRQDKYYLKNLSINVGIVHEAYKFGDVEI